MRISDWSSDVCSSDLIQVIHQAAITRPEAFLILRDPGGRVAPVKTHQRPRLGRDEEHRVVTIQIGTDQRRGLRRLRIGRAVKTDLLLIQSNVQQQAALARDVSSIHAEVALDDTCQPQRIVEVGVETVQAGQIGVITWSSEEHTSELQSLMRTSYA